MNQELLRIVEALARDKNIDKETLFEDLDAAMLSAIRKANGGAEAPVRLIYVVDIDKLAHTSGFQEPGLRDPDVQRSYYYVDTGLIAANVYLFAASMGLAAWFHNCDKSQLSTKLNLHKDQRVLFGQTVGYPTQVVENILKGK